MKQTIIRIAAACVGLSIISYGLVYLYIDIKGFDLSGHGHIAIVIAIFFSYSLGATLMALLFYSNKHGHDDQVQFVLQDTDETSAKLDGEIKEE